MSDDTSKNEEEHRETEKDTEDSVVCSGLGEGWGTGSHNSVCAEVFFLLFFPTIIIINILVVGAWSDKPNVVAGFIANILFCLFCPYLKYPPGTFPTILALIKTGPRRFYAIKDLIVHISMVMFWGSLFMALVVWFFGSSPSNIPHDWTPNM